MDANVVVIAPSAIVDHVFHLDTQQEVQSFVGAHDALGGSKRVSLQAVQELLGAAPSHSLIVSIPAGSAPNVARNLARQGVAVRLVTCCGSDAAGQLFKSGMHAAGVDITHVATVPNADTGQSVILSHGGNRTMRTYISQDTILKASSLDLQHFTPEEHSPHQNPQDSGAGARVAAQQGVIARACNDSSTQHHAACVGGGGMQGPGIASAGFGVTTKGMAPVASAAGPTCHKESSLQAPGVACSGIHLHSELARDDNRGVQGPDQTTACSGQRQVPSRRGSSGWVFLSGYSCYSPELLQRSCELARQAGRRVLLDFASHEVVAAHAAVLCDLILAGMVDVCVCNEDEAMALVKAGVVRNTLPAVDQADQAAIEARQSAAGERCTAAVASGMSDGFPELQAINPVLAAVEQCPDASKSDRAAGMADGQSEHVTTARKAAMVDGSAAGDVCTTLTDAVLSAGGFLGHYCSHMAVVTLGRRGCALFGKAVFNRVMHVPAVSGITPMDATGAGDALSSALLFGLAQGWSAVACAQRGCAAGAAAVQAMGADMGLDEWKQI